MLCARRLSVVDEGVKRYVRTGTRFRIFQQILPEVVVALLLCEVDCAVHVTQPLDDQVQCLLIVSHAAKEKNHLGYKVTILALLVCLRRGERLQWEQKMKRIACILSRGYMSC